MKLNVETLYFHLKKHHKISLVKGDASGHKLGRPRFYKNNRNSAGYLWFLDSPEISVAPGTYLCYETPKIKDPFRTDLLLIDSGEDPLEIYNEIQEIFDLYDNWENDCLQSVEKLQDYNHLLRTTYEIFQIPISLVDNQFSVLASAHADPCDFLLFENDVALNPDTVNDLISNPHLRNLETAGGTFDFEYDRNYKLYNFRYNGKYFGRLIMGMEDTAFEARYTLILDKLAEFVELLILRYGSIHTTSNMKDYLHTYLSDCLQGKIPRKEDINRLQQNTGWADEQRYLVCRFLPEHRLKKVLYPPYLINQVETRWNGCCAVEYENSVVMLLNVSLQDSSDSFPFFQSLAYLVRDGLMNCGCSRIGRGLRDVAALYRQAVHALELGIKKDRTRWYFRFDDYGLDYLMNYGIGSFLPEQVCHPALLKIREYDEQKQTSYYLTLFTYFRQNYNMSQAASQLFIHRSTFIDRMKRIEELTALNLNDYDTRLYLELSFRILQEEEPDLNESLYL